MRKKYVIACWDSLDDALFNGNQADTISGLIRENSIWDPLEVVRDGDRDGPVLYFPNRREADNWRTCHGGSTLHSRTHPMQIKNLGASARAIVEADLRRRAREAPPPVEGYVIRRTRHWYGPDWSDSLIRDEMPGSGAARIFETREAARKWIEEAEDTRYYLDHNEAFRPDYKIVRADRVPKFLAGDLPRRVEGAAPAGDAR